MATAVISAIGLGLSIFGAVQQSKAQKKAAKASARAEQARRRQASFEAIQARRKAIRERQLARAESIANAVSQGVNLESSPVQGGQSGIIAAAARNIRAVNVGEQNRNTIFSANQSVAQAQSQSATAQGISSIGSNIFGSADQLGRLSKFATGSFSSIGSS